MSDTFNGLEHLFEGGLSQLTLHPSGDGRLWMTVKAWNGDKYIPIHMVEPEGALQAYFGRVPHDSQRQPISWLIPISQKIKFLKNVGPHPSVPQGGKEDFVWLEPAQWPVENDPREVVWLTAAEFEAAIEGGALC